MLPLHDAGNYRDQREPRARGDDGPSAGVGRREIEAMAGIPDEVTDAGAEVVAERNDEGRIDQLHERQRQQPCGACLSVRPAHKPAVEKAPAKPAGKAEEAPKSESI